MHNAGRQKKAVAPRARASARASESLQEPRHRSRGVNLDHPVEITDIDAEFERARRHDHAVVARRKGRLCLAPGVHAQRTVGNKGPHGTGAQLDGQALASVVTHSWDTTRDQSLRVN